MNVYQKRAADFCEKTGVTITSRFLRNDKHFDHDDHKRDIYEVVIARGARSFTITFGQSLKNSQKYLYKTGNIAGAEFTLDGYPLRGTRFSRNRETLEFDRTSPYASQRCVLFPGTPPDEYDILAAMTKYDPGTLENFCSEFGYDTDSKRAERVYKSVSEEWLNVQKIWTDREIEELREIV